MSGSSRTPLLLRRPSTARSAHVQTTSSDPELRTGTTGGDGLDAGPAAGSTATLELRPADPRHPLVSTFEDVCPALAPASLSRTVVFAHADSAQGPALVVAVPGPVPRYLSLLPAFVNHLDLRRRTPASGRERGGAIPRQASSWRGIAGRRTLRIAATCWRVRRRPSPIPGFLGDAWPGWEGRSRPSPSAGGLRDEMVAGCNGQQASEVFLEQRLDAPLLRLRSGVEGPAAPAPLTDRHFLSDSGEGASWIFA